MLQFSLIKSTWVSIGWIAWITYRKRYLGPGKIETQNTKYVWVHWIAFIFQSTKCINTFRYRNVLWNLYIRSKTKSTIIKSYSDIEWSKYSFIFISIIKEVSRRMKNTNWTAKLFHLYELILEIGLWIDLKSLKPI